MNIIIFNYKFVLEIFLNVLLAINGKYVLAIDSWALFFPSFLWFLHIPKDKGQTRSEENNRNATACSHFKVNCCLKVDNNVNLNLASPISGQEVNKTRE